MIQIKKTTFITLLVIVGLLFGVVGVGASGGIERIQAALNHNITFLLDGAKWTPKDNNGNKLSALVYNGSTYVPLRAVSEALDAEVNWDGSTSTITINKSDDNFGIPYKDANNNGNNNGNSGNTSNKPNPPKETEPVASGNSGTLSNPVKLGTTFTYQDAVNYSDVTKAKFSVTVHDATKITTSYIEDLGFRVSSDNDFDYYLVDMSVKASDISFTADKENGLGYTFMTNITPSIWGSVSVGGSKIIGGTPHGFDGSLNSELRAFLGDDMGRLTDGASGKSYNIRGKVILPVTKGEESYLVLRNQDSKLDYEKSFYYFKLK